MKHLILLSVVAFVLTNPPVHASEPAVSFINEMIQCAGDNFWWVYPQEIEDQTIIPPKGGYLFRFNLELDGEGTEGVFLLSSLDVTKNSEPWTLYQQESSGAYVKLSDNIFINGPPRMKNENGTRKYSCVTPPDKDTGLEEALSFWLDGAGSLQSSTRQLTEDESKAINGGDPALLGADGLPDDDKIAQYLNIGDPVALNIEKVLVGKLYQSPTASWRAVNNTFSLSQQYLDPADAADIASLVSWTPPSDP